MAVIIPAPSSLILHLKARGEMSRLLRMLDKGNLAEIITEAKSKGECRRLNKQQTEDRLLHHVNYYGL
jgi:hypothetical protein